MTASNVLPLRPADGENEDVNAQVRARAREDEPRRRTYAPPWIRLQLLFAGASVIGPMQKLWAEHAASARAYEHRWARWPVYAWGAVHAWVLASATGFLLWATRSLPRAAFTTAVIATVLWQFRLTVVLQMIWHGHMIYLEI